MCHMLHNIYFSIKPLKTCDTCCIVQCDAHSTLWNGTLTRQLWPFLYSPPEVLSCPHYPWQLWFWPTEWEGCCLFKMFPSHPPVPLFYSKYNLAMLLWRSLSGGLPTYSRDVLLTAFSVVQYQHNITAPYTILNSLSLSITQMFSGIPQYLLIRPNIKKKKKNLGKAKVKIYSYRRFYGSTF